MKKSSILLLFYLIACSVQGQIDSLYSSPVRIQASDSLDEKWGFLKPVLQDKRIVALGESLHGVKEYNTYKLELIQYLHEELGFNVIALESDLAMNFIGNQYRDQISDTLLLKKLITPVWHTEQHLKLIQYLKSHPALNLIGFDLIDIHAIDSAFETLSITPSAQFSQETLVQYYQLIQPLYKNETHFYNGFRDTLMAKNLHWIIEELYPDEKIIISAANDHIAKMEMSRYGYMGKLLAQDYLEEYYSIGFFHGLGNPTHVYRDFFYENTLHALPIQSLQARLLNLNIPSFFMDIQQLKTTDTYAWLNQEVQHILQTGTYTYPIQLTKAFDAIIWIDQVTPPHYIIESKYHWRKR